MKYIAITVGLFASLYFEVSIFHFPIFFVYACLLLIFERSWVWLILVFFVALLLDSLIVNVFGVTAFCIFLYIGVVRLFSVENDLRGQIVLFVSLLLSTIFYSMIVEYPAHIGVYLILAIFFVALEYFSKRRSYTLPWV